ncbi:MAG: hypothetical protein AABY32_01505 [Nanoarchaeota archaeon]
MEVKEQVRKFEWNEFDIIQNQAKFLMEEENIDEKKAFDITCEDPDLISFEWDSFLDMVTEELKEMNPGGDWACNVKGFGWRKLDGHTYFNAKDAKEFFSKILPDCECRFIMNIFPCEKTISINNFHHDSPYGEEWYYLEPVFFSEESKNE